MSVFEMGGYAAYVWPAYGISALALIALGIASWRALMRNELLVSLAETPEKKS